MTTAIRVGLAALLCASAAAVFAQGHMMTNTPLIERAKLFGNPEKAQGRIVTAAGKSLGLELRPGTGGALLSLAAFQALGLSLTELPQVTVYGP